MIAHAPDRAKLIDQLKRHEGTKRDKDGRHIAYRCTAGALTIGYGHNLDANPVPGVSGQSKLTEDQAERLLEADVLTVQGQLERSLPWAGSLPFVRYAVLVNMAFNLGIAGLLSFTGTLDKAKRGDYSGTAQNMLKSKWAGQVGKRAQELAKQMESGQWQF